MTLEEKYSENAIKIYEKLYLARDKNNNVIETIEQCHDRVCNFLANDEEEYQNFKRMLDEQKFRPNTPCMANAGIKENPMMLACFVLDLQDTMESIIDMWSTCANIYAGGGGAGIPITNLRRKGSGLSNGGYASGPLSYLNVIETISNEIKSGGKQRRAANLIAAEYNHPDIEEIINCKRDKNSFKSMNLSVVVDNEFMQTICSKNKDKEPKHRIVDPNEGPLGSKSSEDLWDQICQAAWETGDPGLLFIDRVNEDNPLDIQIESTNPCGESPLWPSSCCDLGHFNVTKYDGPNDPEFENDIYWGTLFLNRIIDKSSYPNKSFKENMQKYRPIGLGLMGFADFLYKRKIPYGSENSIDIIRNFTRELTKIAFASSSDLVAQGKIPDMTKNLREHEFNNFKKILDKFGFSDGLDTYMGYIGWNHIPGNITVTTLAPTGSTALSADCSFSTEPNFAVFWTKKLDGGGTLDFLNEYFLDALYKTDGPHKDKYSQKELIELIKENNGSIQNIEHLPPEIKKVFVTAHDIPNDQRIEMQAAAQKNISMAVSSTVNLPQSATKESISEIYKTAWKKGLKGITVYRDGSLDDQPVDFGSGSTQHTQHEEEHLSMTLESFEYTQPLDRPDDLSGSTKKILTGSGELYLTVNWYNGRPFEVFATIGKGGRSMAAKAEAIGRLVSLAMRCGVHIDHIIKQLEGIGGDYPIFQNGGLIKSIPDAIASVLRDINDQEKVEEFFQKEENVVAHIPDNDIEMDICPECGQPALRKDAGCRGGICTICGFSNCY